MEAKRCFFLFLFLNESNICFPIIYIVLTFDRKYGSFQFWFGQYNGYKSWVLERIRWTETFKIDLQIWAQEALCFLYYNFKC